MYFVAILEAGLLIYFKGFFLEEQAIFHYKEKIKDIESSWVWGLTEEAWENAMSRKYFKSLETTIQMGNMIEIVPTEIILAV